MPLPTSAFTAIRGLVEPGEISTPKFFSDMNNCQEKVRLAIRTNCLPRVRTFSQKWCSCSLGNTAVVFALGTSFIGVRRAHLYGLDESTCNIPKVKRVSHSDVNYNALSKPHRIRISCCQLHVRHCKLLRNDDIV